MEKKQEKKPADYKTMPHSVEAEQSILGCLLINSEVPVAVMASLTEDDFYSRANGIIFDCMQELYNKNTPIDFVTVTSKLEEKGQLENVGGVEYITHLTNIVPSATNFKHYLEIVKKNSLYRRLISCGEEIITNAYQGDDETKEQAIAKAEKLIFDISQSEETSSLEHVGKALTEAISKLNAIAKDPTCLQGLKTGLKELDSLTNGLQKSDLILIAARPGVGKTSLAMNIATNAAIKENASVAIFSLEMPREQIARRAVCSIANVSMEKAVQGKLSIDEWKALHEANKKLSASKIYIDDSSINQPTHILSKCRRLKREHGLDLIVVDYLQLMSANSSKKNIDNRQQEISEITRTMKIAARELNVPILLLSQLSRATETRKDHRPILSDLRESGSIEQDADIVMFIYNAKKYNDVVSEDEPNVCELIIGKHRNGRTDTIKVRWIPEISSFTNKDDLSFYKNHQQTAESDEAELVEVDDNTDDVF